MARLTREELGRFHDGEVSASERARIEAALSSAPGGERAHLEKLDRIGDLVRLMHEEQMTEVSFDGFTERVAAGIRAESKPSLGARIGVFFSEFFEHRRRVWIPTVSLVGAAAAVLLALPVLRGPQGASLPSPAATGPIWTAAASGGGNALKRSSEAILTNRDQVSGVELVVSNERGESIGVVWVND